MSAVEDAIPECQHCGITIEKPFIKDEEVFCCKRCYFRWVALKEVQRRLEAAYRGTLEVLVAALLTIMAIITILIPGMIILRDVPHFAYAFATAGGALALFLLGGGAYNQDAKMKRSN